MQKPNTKTNKRVAVLLFGDYEYDGRARRLAGILAETCDVRVFHTGATQALASGHHNISIVNCSPSPRWNRYSRHAIFWGACFNQLRSYRPDWILCSNFFTVFPGLIFSKLLRRPFVYDAYELIIATNEETQPVALRVWAALERLSIYSAKLVISANPERSKLMAGHYSLEEKPVHFRNIPHFEEKYASTVNEPKTSHDFHHTTSKRRYKVLYQGNMDFSRGLLRFIEAVRWLPNSFDMIVVGGGKDLERLRRILIQENLTNRVKVVGRVPFERLNEITKQCDVGIVTYPFTGLNNIYCSPNKIFEYIQGGLPIVATNQPGILRIVSHYKIGRVVGEEATAQEIALQIVEASKLKDSFYEERRRFLLKYNFLAERERLLEALTQKTLMD